LEKSRKDLKILFLFFKKLGRKWIKKVKEYVHIEAL
jgi:hypothetical protein